MSGDVVGNYQFRVLSSHGARRTAHGARLRPLGKTAFAVIALILGGFFALTLADKASAQQLPPSSISYTTEPTGLISITADKQVIVLSQPAAGVMTVTISGVGFTLVGGEYVRTGYTGQDTLTLRFLTSCSIRDGCDAFGLESADINDRTRAFRAMDLTTLSMFVASGADVNENTGSTAGGFLLMQMALEGRGAAVSLLITAGADINATDDTGSTMLHIAGLEANRRADDALPILLAVNGISVNALNNQNSTPLDAMAGLNNFLPGVFPTLPERAEAIRNAGGRCIAQAGSDDAEIVAICGAAQQSPDISLPNNANKTFIIRSPDINTPGVIGIISATPRR